MTTQVATVGVKDSPAGSQQWVYRLRRGLARDARPARRQGRERRRDDARARRRPRPGRLHDHHRGVRRLHARRRSSRRASTEQVAEALARLEERAGKRLGDPDDPLLVSVRSGARESMPGMLDTVLNLGLNDDVGRRASPAHRQRALRLGLLPALRADVRQRRARASPGEQLRGRDRALKQRARASSSTRSSTSTRCASWSSDVPGALRASRRTRASSCAQAIRAVFDSWNGERAVAYRRINRIPDDWGTAVNVQQMVFGNKGETLGLRASRSAATR